MRWASTDSSSCARRTRWRSPITGARPRSWASGATAGGPTWVCSARRCPASEVRGMPSYLQRVVTSGARTAPTARPPVAISPPLPALAHPMPVIEVPAGPDVAPGRSEAPVKGVEMLPASASPAHPAPSIPHPPPAAARPHETGASAAARGGEIARADAGTTVEVSAPAHEGAAAQGRARDDESTGGGAPAAVRPARAGSEDDPGGHDAVIRAPRGLRPDAGVPAVLREMAATL